MSKPTDTLDQKVAQLAARIAEPGPEGVGPEFVLQEEKEIENLTMNEIKHIRPVRIQILDNHGLRCVGILDKRRGRNVEAYKVVWRNPRVEVLWYPDQRIAGIAWGDDVTWTRGDTVEECVERVLITKDVKKV